MNSTEYFNDTETGFDISAKRHSLVPQILFYTALFVVGVPANALVVVVLRKSSQVSSIVDHFLLNLAIADLGVLLLYAPFYVAYEFLDLVWPFGSFMCKAVFSLTHVCMYASLATLVGIAIERYYAAFRTPMRKSSAKLYILVTWMLSILVCIPDISLYQLVELEPDGPQVEYACDIVWPNEKYEQVFQLVDFVLLYITPLVFITVIYIKIIRKLRHASQKQFSKFNFTQLKHIREALRTLIAVVIVFAFSLLPIHVLHLIRVFFPDCWIELYFDCPWVFSVCAFLVLGTHAINPVVYGSVNQRIRREATMSVKLLFSKPAKPKSNKRTAETLL